MAYTTLENLKSLSISFKSYTAIHISIGEVRIIGFRIESDLSDNLEVYVKDVIGHRFWVGVKTLTFKQD